jgi:predicted  nucleic acid-binding Zn-ribbon protein
MGFFERLGRKTEAVKQRVDSARAGAATHRCADCGQLLYADRETCPECGSAAVEELAGDAAGGNASEAADRDTGGTTEASEDGESTADRDGAAER